MKSMRVVEVRGARRLELVERRMPVPAPREILVRTEFCGICGSDVDLYRRGILPGGTVMGHELAGRVVATGSEAGDLREGDAVVLNSSHFCGACRHCLAQQIWRCPENRTVGFGDLEGGLAEYLCLTESMVSRLPSELSTDTAALLDPLSIAYSAVLRSPRVLGQLCYVMGLGSVGLALCAVLRLAGARRVVGADPLEARRKLAERFGADPVIGPRETPPGALLEELTGGDGPGVVYDASGAPGAMSQAMSLAPREGTAVLVGICLEPEPVVNAAWVLRQVNLITSFGYTKREAEAVLALVAEARLDPTPMVTERVNLDRVPDVFERLCRPTIEGKILVEHEP